MRVAAVTSDAVGNREIVSDGENGFQVPTRDIQAWVEALTTLIEDRKLRQRMGRRSRELVTKYDWYAVSRAYLQLFEIYAAKDKAVIHAEKCESLGR